MVLHTVNRSIFSHKTLSDCLNRINKGDALVLLENGVYALHTEHELSQSLGAIEHCYAIKHDVLARGLTVHPSNGSIELIDYTRFVELSCEFPRSISWY